MSRPTVHPVEEPPFVDDGPRYPGVRMKDVQGMPGTRGGLTLRLIQSVFGLISVCVMATSTDFRTVSAFCLLVFAVGFQVLWTVSLAVVDVYALLVRRRLRKHMIVQLFAAGDGITSTLTFAAASASAGITVLVRADLNRCSVNHCIRSETATAFAFISWFALMPSFLMNFWMLATQ